MKKFIFILLGFGTINAQDCSTLTINQNDTVICKGDSLELSTLSGYNYLWSNNESTSSIIVTPYETTTYSLQISSVGIDFTNTNPDETCSTEEFTLGDVNYDQLINVQDIVLIVEWMLNGEYSVCGDVNCDQILNENDIEIIENFILGLGDIPGCISCIDEIVVYVETCGCLDPLACNYCPTCTMDDNSCWYLEDCYNNSLQEGGLGARLLKSFTTTGLPVSNKTNQVHIQLFDDKTVRKILWNE